MAVPVSSSRIPKPSTLRPAIILAGAYLIFAILWITVTDGIVARLAEGHERDFITHLQTWKGWSFVTATAILIFIVSATYLGRLHRSHQKITALQQQMYLLMQSTEDYGIYLLDKNGYVISWNPGAEKIKGYKAEEAMGHHLSDFFSEEEREAMVPQRLLAIAAKEGSAQLSGWRPRKDGGRYWGESRLIVLRDESGDVTGYAKITEDLTEKRRNEEQVRKSRNELRDLAHRLDTVRHDEAKRIAREIHDDLGQNLSALKMDLEMAAAHAGQDNPDTSSKTSEKISSAQCLVNRCLESVRQLCSELRLSSLEDLPLDEAVRTTVREFGDRYQIESICQADPVPSPLSERTAHNCYRILQEALTNVARHAKATSVKVTFSAKNGYLQLMVEDNGIGVSGRAKTTDGHLGLVGMRERALLVHGEFHIVAVEPHGTRILLEIPLHNDSGRDI